MTPDAKPAIEPTRVYTPEETAELLGFRGDNAKAASNSVYATDAAELPRTRTGPSGGRVGFLSAVIGRYIAARTDEPGVEMDEAFRLSRLARRPDLLRCRCECCWRTVYVSEDDFGAVEPGGLLPCPFCQADDGVLHPLDREED